MLMGETGVFIQNMDGSSIELTWIELNQLRKDILWVFDQNVGDLWNPFVPLDSMTLPYWVYTTLNSDSYSNPAELQFLREGAMIIILCVITEHIDVECADREVFKYYKPETIGHYIHRIEADSEQQEELIALIRSGLRMAADLDNNAYWDEYGYHHPERDAYFAKLGWVNDTFIVPYFRSRV